MNTILRIAIPCPLRQTFDYLPPDDYTLHHTLQPGMRVLVPFGRQKIIGFIHTIAQTSAVNPTKLKAALEVLDTESLIPSSIFELIEWTSNYYHHPIGDVFTNAIPSLLREKPCKKNYDYNQRLAKNADKILEPHIDLNAHQKKAYAAISKNLTTFQTFLLHGVTGSGKTEIYLQVIAEVLKAGKQALVLVPEINLTPQTIERFTARFAVPIAVLHSRLTPKERLISWQMAKDGSAPIIIGTRSAIFTPQKNPGIIILDEEHDLSFKQQSGLRYSARDLAIIRGKLENVPVILGSATPSLETLANVKRKNFVYLSLPERTGSAIHPTFHLIDMRNQKLRDGIAENLLKAIEQHLFNKNQILIFINRRGYAPVLICHECGWAARCKNCDAHMTYHQQQKQLHCHHCGIVKHIPTKCPECNSTNLTAVGVGTERVEAGLRELFPTTQIVRIDRDTTRKKGAIHQMLDDIQQNTYQILIGTQMLAKGHHFPNVTMVAILNVDNGLFSADFRATEHLAQLIIQVAGRAGRAEKPGEVYIQTHNPHHPLLTKLISEGYTSFAKDQLQERATAALPPSAYLAIIHSESKDQNAALDFLHKLRNNDKDTYDQDTKFFGPVPNIMERKAGFYRAQLLMQSNKRNSLHQSITKVISTAENLKVHNVKWYVDVDPIDLQ